MNAARPPGPKKKKTEGQRMAARRRAGKNSRKKTGHTGLVITSQWWERKVDISRRYE
jgi:hypothetical protein